MAEGHVIQRPGAQYIANENTPPYEKWNPTADGHVYKDYGGDGKVVSTGTYYMDPDAIEYRTNLRDYSANYVASGIVGNDKDNLIHGGGTWKTHVGPEWGGERKYHHHEDYIAGGGRKRYDLRALRR